MKLIVDCETGETKEINPTAKDVKQQEIDEAAMAKLEAEKAAKEAEKEAVLAKLGLSAEELAVLLA